MPGKIEQNRENLKIFCFLADNLNLKYSNIRYGCQSNQLPNSVDQVDKINYCKVVLQQIFKQGNQALVAAVANVLIPKLKKNAFSKQISLRHFSTNSPYQFTMTILGKILGCLGEKYDVGSKHLRNVDFYQTTRRNFPEESRLQ